MAKNFLKSSIVVTLAFVLFFAPLSLPPKAHAMFIPVMDVPNTPNQVGTNVSTLAEKLKDYGLDGLAWSLAKTAARRITADLVDWINSGFEGNPVFVNDIGGFFLDIGDSMAGEFIFNDPNWRFLCNPFGLGAIDLRLNLSFSYFSGFREKVNCRLTDVFRNVQSATDFTKGDFYKGGWDGWLSVSQVRQNNRYGQFSIGFEEMTTRVAGRQQTNKQLLEINKGFKAATDEINDIIAMPGGVIHDSLTNTFGSGQRSLEAADELAEMIGAIVGALLNQAFTKGLQGISSRGSTGSNSFTSQLRTNSRPMIEPSSGEMTGAVTTGSEGAGYGDFIDSVYEEDYQREYAKALQNSQGCTIPQQQPKISMTDAVANQTCTERDQERGLGPASYAIDGTDSTTAAARYCTGVSTVFWEVKLPRGEYIEQISYQTYKEDRRLFGFPYSSKTSAARFTLTDSAGITKYACIVSNDPNVTVNLTGNLCTPASATSDNGSVILPLSESYRPDKVKLEAGQGGDNGILLSELRLYRHLAPVVSTCNVPTSFTSDQPVNLVAMPGQTPFITVTHFPTYNNPTEINTLDEMRPWLSVKVKDQAGNVVGTDYTQSLKAGSYIVEYTAQEPSGARLSSGVFTRSITVQGTGGTVVVPVTNDTTPPSTPTNLTGSKTTVDGKNAAALSWTSSTDEGGSGVVGYNIFRNNIKIGQTSGNYFTDSGDITNGVPVGLPNGIYAYRVQAFDGAQNISFKSEEYVVPIP